jgi:uncharacterized membrane protein
MDLLPEWIPNVHPIVVHFPIAFLITAIFVDILSVFLKRQDWIKYSAIMLYSIGTVAAVIAYLSGRQAADSVYLPPLANPVLNHHADLALMTVFFFIFFTLIRVISVWKVKKKYVLISIILLILSLPGLYLIIETGEHGAELVYNHGVGVHKVEYSKHEKESPILLPNRAVSLFEDQGGSWRWNPDIGDESDLIHKFNWLKGSADSVNIEIIKAPPNDNKLKLRVNNEYIFITRGKNLKSVQADLYINLNDFKGSVQLVHHTQDDLNYDFVKLEAKRIILGRLSEGKIKIMDDKSVTFKDWIKLGVVGDGTHFRGYINDKLYTHGHGPELRPGTVGLIINGDGAILLDKIEVKSLK